MKKKKTDTIIKASQPKRRKSRQNRHGPEGERLKIEGDWIRAIDRSLTVKRPPEGWLDK
jgi:hypothetical protein